MADPIKVLIVDDAAFMVKALTELLETDPEIEVVGAARNGKEALQKIIELEPEVVTLDVDMPIMDGINTVRHIMIESPLPVVMLSSLFSHGDITFEALRLGVVDFLPKPSGAISKDIHEIRQHVIDRVKIAASQKTENVRRVRLAKWDIRGELTDHYRYQSLDYLVAIGTTLGGPNTVINLISRLPPNLPTAVVVVQELAPGILPAFVEKFDEFTPWNIEVAEEGTVIEQGTCYICSYAEPMVVAMDLEKGAYLTRPNGDGKPLDNLFSTAANVFGQHTIGVLLTGIGDDGHVGFGRIKEEGGVTMAQTVNTCVYPNLAQCAIERNVVDRTVDANKLFSEIEKVIEERAADEDMA